MNTTTRSILLALIFTSASVALYRYANSLIAPPEQDISTLPTLIGSNVHAINYHFNGQVDNKLDGQEVIYYETARRLEGTKLHINHYDYRKDERGQVWNLDTDKGEILIDDVAHLKGSVRLYPSFDETAVRLITSDAADYFFQNNTVVSDRLVTIYGTNFMDSGTDFSADLTNQNMHFKSNSYGIYTPAQE